MMPPKVFEKKKYNTNTAKLVGTYAGEYINDYDLRLKQQLEAMMSEAKIHFNQASLAWSFRNYELAAQEVDEALRIVSEAFWYADETELEKKPHKLLHQIAKWKHDTIGCHLIKQGDEYIQRCKVAITHRRMGFSAGLTGTPVCTLCGKSEFDCEHSKDKTYWTRGGTNKQGECFICLEKSCTEHSDSYIYKVSPTTRITNPVLHEVSMVRKPRFPLARMQEVPISKEEIEANAGIIDESKGMVYTCHTCGGSCPGFQEFLGLDSEL